MAATNVENMKKLIETYFEKFHENKLSEKHFDAMFKIYENEKLIFDIPDNLNNNPINLILEDKIKKK